MYMKKNLSLASFSLVAMGLFMGSCVSKRKYMEAQTSAAARYTTDSTQWADRSNTMQKSMSALEQKSTTYQKQMDSFKTSSMNYQKRWDNFQTTYTKQTSSTEQLHEQIHTAIDQYVESSNVESRNGKVYINLPEKMLFTSGSSSLSAKGKQALDKLAAVLASNDNIEVDILTSAAYYNNGESNTSMSEGSTSSMDKNNTVKTSMNTPEKTSVNTTEKDNAVVTDNANKTMNDSTANTTAKKSKAVSSDKIAQPSNQNKLDSTSPVNSSVTSNETMQDPTSKNQGVTKTRPVKKTSTVSSTNNEGDRSMTFKSTPKNSKSKTTASTPPNWNLNVARSTAIVRQLTQTGLPQARIVLTGQNGKGITTNEWASTNRGYQIVLTPKMDYYKMMQEGQGSTSMK